MTTHSKILRPPKSPDNLEGMSVDLSIVAIDRYLKQLDFYLGSSFINEYRSEDEWHVIGDGGESAFQNGWSNYGNGYSPISFIRVASNVVMLTGLVTGGTAGTTTGVFTTIPEDFRPTDYKLFHIATAVGSGSCIINPTNGEIRINTGASGNWNSLDGLVYRIE